MKKKIKELLHSKSIIILAIFAILFSILVVFALTRDVQNKMDESAITTTQNLLERLSDYIGASIEYDKKAIEEYADFIKEDPQSTQYYLKNMMDHYQFLEVNWIGQNGQYYNQKEQHINIDDLPIEVISINDEKSFSRAVEGSFGVWECVYQIPVGQEGILYVRIPVKKYDNGQNMTFYGDKGLAYLFDLESKKIILTPKVPNVMWAYMQDTNAIFEEIGFDESDLNNQIYPALKNKDAIVLQGTLEGEKYYISLKVLESHDEWYLCSVIPASQIQQESSLILQMLFVILIICVGIVCAIFAYVIFEILKSNKQQKEHLKVIEMQNAIYDAMADASDTLVCIFDRKLGKMELVFQNSQKVIGISSYDLMHDVQLLQTLFEKADQTLYVRLLKGQVQPVEEYYCQIIREQELCDLKLTLKKIKVDGVHKYIIFIQDVTADMRLRESLETAVADAQQANGAKSEFLSRMSHEIRTPMNAIIGMSEIASRSLSNESKVADCLKKIKISSRHLLSLMNDILDISKIESGKMTLNHDSFSLSDCMSEVYGIISIQAQAKNQKLHIKTAGVLNDAFIGDDMRLKQILINLLNNAVKYTPEKGCIQLLITEEEASLKNHAMLVFTIEDNGIGMSKEFIQRIGNPFEQEKNEFHRSEGGTGLGLAIVKNVVSIMGGLMHITSELGKGTCIRISLSFERDESQQYQQIEQFNGLNVLIIDNEHDSLMKTGQYLNDFNIKYKQETQLESAYLHIKNQEEIFDVIIMDDHLSIENCLKFVKEIRRIDLESQPYIMIASYNCSSIENNARKVGVDDFIEKPLLKNRLYQSLNHIRQDIKIQEEHQFINLKGKHVLVVEDNLLNREIAVELLEMVGVIVDSAENGLQALEMFKASSLYYYDLILMDIQMPVMNGLEATRKIHQLEREDAQVHIMAMSANAYPDDIQKCYDSGMIGHLPKPIEVERLYRILSEHMGEMRYETDEKNC